MRNTIMFSATLAFFAPLGLAGCASGETSTETAAASPDEFLGYDGKPEQAAVAIYEKATGQTETYEEVGGTYADVSRRYDN